MITRTLLAIIALAAAGCSAVPAATPIIIYVTPSPGATPAPTEVATVAPQPTETPRATPALPTPRPTPTRVPEADAEKGQPLLRTWSDNGYVTAQILLPITNTGDAWIELLEYDSQWTIYDGAGGILETGSFRAGAPEILAPTGQSYLVGEWFGDDYSQDDFASVEADAYFREVDPPASILTADNVSTRRHSFGGVEVVGELTNLGTEDVDNADVVALFFDANGELLGFANGYAENIAAGGKRAFQIDSSFAEIRLSDVAETKVFASSW